MTLKNNNKTFSRKGILMIFTFVMLFLLVACTPKVMITDLSFSQEAMTMVVGEKKNLQISIEPIDGHKDSIIWSSNKPEFASVAKGEVSAIAKGTAVITATVGDIKATITINVVGDKHNIVFDTDGGGAIDTLVVNNATVATKPDNPTKPGYTFAGWYTSKDHTTEFSFDNAITNDITLYAKWTLNEFTITYQVNGGTGVDSEKVTGGNVATKPDNPTKDGYNFSGWYVNEQLSLAFAFSTKINKDYTLYAKWVPITYTVQFNVDGGSYISSQTISFGGKATPPTPPTKFTYLFDGWYTSNDFTTVFNFNDVVDKNLVVYAKWKFDASMFKNIKYNLNGGEWSITAHNPLLGGNPTQTFPLGYYHYGYSTYYQTSIFLYNAKLPGGNAFYSHRIALKLNDNNVYEIVRKVMSGTAATDAELAEYDYLLVGHDGFPSGFSFLADLDVGDIVAISGFNISETSYGKVEGTVNVYPAGKTIPETTIIMKDLDLPIPTLVGSIFDGWYTNADFSGEKVTKATIDGDLYAKWKGSYNVVFETNGGSEVPSQKVPGTKAIRPTDPTKSGFAFAGWFIDTALKTPFDFNNPITDHTTLYAKWSEGVVISFMDNDGVVRDSIRILENTALVKPANPTKSGFELVGWYTDAGLQVPYDFKTLVEGDLTLYAKWVVQYSLSYNTNGGTLRYDNKEAMIIDFLTDFYDYVKPTENLTTFMHGDGKTSGFNGTWHSSYFVKIFDGPKPSAADDSKPYFIYQSKYYEKWMPFFDMLNLYTIAVNDTQTFWHESSTFVGEHRILDYISERYNRTQDSMIPSAFVFRYTFTENTDTFVLNNAVKTGFVFGGWYGSSDFSGEAITSIPKGTKTSYTLYAKWN